MPLRWEQRTSVKFFSINLCSSGQSPQGPHESSGSLMSITVFDWRPEHPVSNCPSCCFYLPRGWGAASKEGSLLAQWKERLKCLCHLCLWPAFLVLGLVSGQFERGECCGPWCSWFGYITLHWMGSSSPFSKGPCLVFLELLTGR